MLTLLKGGRSVKVEVYCEFRSEAEEIAARFGGAVRWLAEKNWAAMRPVRREPLRIRRSLVITAESSERAVERVRGRFPGREVVSIPAEMAFGTGEHATTAACLRFLADEARARRGTGWRMLDLGTGSGVLAIAAHRLGAAECEAVDHDPAAVVVARRNVERNRARGVRVVE